MMLAILAESALRSLVLGSVVWVGLNLLRVRNPHVHMTSWVLVLVASLSMPLLMHWTTVPSPGSLAVAEPENLAHRPAGAVRASARLTRNGCRGSPSLQSGVGLATAIACVAGMPLPGLVCYRPDGVWPAQQPMREPWAAKSDVRVSHVVGGPVTFGSTILLPPHYIDWNLHKRQAVLAHEGAHVANRDFYVLLLASLNRAVFWFSPLAWWQFTRLAELAEIISDAEALEVVEDRVSYAEILLDLVQHVRQAPAGLEMARACTVGARVERILAATAAPAKAGWRRIWTAAAILPVVMLRQHLTAPRWRPSAREMRPRPCTCRNTSSSIHWPHIDLCRFPRRRRSVRHLSGQRVLTVRGKRRTYSYPAAAGHHAGGRR